jgi:hypothetical protein
MKDALNVFLNTLTNEGGLLRVRAQLVLWLTGIGGGYLLAYQALPPPEYMLIWATAAAYYFGTRGASGGG